LLDDPEYLTMGRELRRNGRSIARINGRSVGVTLMREIGEYLVDIHGQSEHLSLKRVQQHLGLLDRFTQIEDTLAPYQKTYRKIVAVRKELEMLRQAERDAARRTDLLTYQIDEIEAANLNPEEEAGLRAERNRLANAEGLASLSQEALQFLDEGTPENPAITDLLGQVVSSLENLAKIDTGQNPSYAKADTMFQELTDLAMHLRDYLENIEFNPKRLEQVEDRLDLINILKRKYGESIQAVLEFGIKARQELETITNAGERIEELAHEETQLLEKLGQRGQKLSDQRHATAAELQQQIITELEDLKMPGARFKVDFQQKETPTGVPLPDGRRVAFDINGLERVEFLVETNPGEGFKPLVRIASGGETARLMLALKNVLAQADRVPTLVFDEIDQGIGGRVGAIVGQKLWRLATQHQVLCITHLAQLAGYGQQHYQVLKDIDDGRTITQVHRIDGDNRIHELAQMLGEVSNGTLQSAHEIMQSVEEFAQNT